jgi:hypothetical protein
VNGSHSERFRHSHVPSRWAFASMGPRSENRDYARAIGTQGQRNSSLQWVHGLRGGVHLLVVGERGKRQLLARGIKADSVEPAAPSLQGVRDLVKRLASRVDRHYAALGLGPVHVIYSRYQFISQQVPTEEELLPPRSIGPGAPAFSGGRTMLP